MSDLLDFPALFQESIATVRARLDADANAGLTTADPEYVDTREGSFYFDVTQVFALEAARLWDAIAIDVPGAAFPNYAWGIYLDAHAAVFGYVRKDATPAGGEVKFSGTNGATVASGTVVSTVPTSDQASAIEFQTTESGVISGGIVTLAVEALVAGSAGNVSAGALTQLVSPNAAVTAVTNDAATLGGTDDETDEELRDRLLLAFQGQGAGNINDYKRWALSIAGVGRVFVNPVGYGAGTVQVVVMDASGQPLSAAIVDAVQEYLDPSAGTADGKAPVGITVVVETPTVIPINVAATVTHKAGYSLDGTGGTIATRSLISAAIVNYLSNLDVGEDVIYEHVKACFYQVPGVYTVASVTVNSGTADVAITANPAQVAQLGTLTLS